MDDTTRQLSQLYRRSARPQTRCPSSTQLATLAQGGSWPWQRRGLTAHLAECPHCSAEFRSLLAIRDGLHDALDIPRQHSPSRGGWITALGTAGACTALLALVLLMPQGQQSSAPGGSESDLLFASTFAPASDSKADDTLFRGDFDSVRSDTVFRSDFGSQIRS